eukprot:COSAG01_NODE_40099_length_467_cov_19.000000_2_plen_68_part_01
MNGSLCVGEPRGPTSSSPAWYSDMSAGADEPLGEEVMRRLFRGLDLDGSGYLERSEVRTMATMMGVDI